MEYYERVAKTVGLALLLATLVGSAIALLVMATDAFFLVFLAILFAVLLSFTAAYLNRWLPLGYAGNLGLLVMLLLGATVAGGYLLGSAIEQQIQRTSQQMDRSVADLENWLQKRPYTRQMVMGVPVLGGLLKQELSGGKPSGAQTSPQTSPQSAVDTTTQQQQQQPEDTVPPAQGQASVEGTDLGLADVKLEKLVEQSSAVSGSVLPILGKSFSTTFGLLTNLAVVLFVGLFLAVDPQLYRNGLVGLFSKASQPKARHVIDKIGRVLFMWLCGRLWTMLITGVGTGVGLWFLGVPLAGTVGVITALLTFIPNIGGLLALLLAALLALSQGPTTVLWVLGFYCVLQLIESNVLTPLIQQHQTSIPPALLISFQLLVGVLTGFLGLMVATPLLAAIMVVVDETWHTTPESNLRLGDQR